MEKYAFHQQATIIQACFRKYRVKKLLNLTFEKYRFLCEEIEKEISVDNSFHYSFDFVMKRYSDSSPINSRVKICNFYFRDKINGYEVFGYNPKPPSPPKQIKSKIEKNLIHASTLELQDLERQLEESIRERIKALSIGNGLELTP
jgi:hypothetical protein